MNLIQVDLKKLSTRIFILDLIFILAFLIGFRFEDLLLQELASSIVIISTVCVVASFILKIGPHENGTVKFVVAIFKILVGVLAVFVLLVTLLSNSLNVLNIIKYGENPYLVPQQNLKIGQRESVVVYQTNGGATTDFGIKIRTEKNLLPGLIFVESVAKYYHVKSIDLEYIGSGEVRVIAVEKTTSYDEDRVTVGEPAPAVGDILKIR